MSVRVVIHQELDVVGKVCLLGLIIFSLNAQAAYKVSYLELDAETYLPVTQETIDQQSTLTYSTSSDDLDTIFNYKKHVNDQMKGKIFNIRCRIERLKDKKVIYIDQSRRLYDSHGEIYMEREIVSRFIKEVEDKKKYFCSLKKNPRDVRIKCLGIDRKNAAEK